jgi:DNA-binding CsgD family transcriptional regulator
VQTAPGLVASLPYLSLEPGFRRGHGMVYQGLSEGGVDEEALRGLLVAVREPGWPLAFAIDASVYPRPEAECSPGREWHHPSCRALRAGASGFLLKDANAAELVHAVRVVAGGEALLAPSVTRRLIADFARLPRQDQLPAPELDVLTKRETEVLRLIARGLSNAEISDALVIADQTTKTYVGRFLAKLGLRDRAQAVVVAYESGLVTPGSR